MTFRAMLKFRQFIPFLAADSVLVAVPLGQQALNAMNAERASRSLPPLDWDEPLVAVALQRAATVQALGRLSHTGYAEAIKVVYPEFKWAGENLAAFNIREGDLATRVVSGWMGSPPHRDNILFDEFSACAVAETIDTAGTHWIAAEFRG